jgi:hypothetical protein
MLGSAAVVIWCDVAAEARGEFEDWHTREHMPERLAIPGFLRGTRWRSEPPGSFFILYELDSPATLEGPAYLARLNDPTPWSRKMMPHHRNMVRSLCRVRERYGEGLSQATATIRFAERSVRVELPTGKGLTSAAILEAQPMRGPQTTEQKIRGGDAGADAVLLIGGYDTEAVEAAAREARIADSVTGFYRLAYSLSS